MEAKLYEKQVKHAILAEYGARDDMMLVVRDVGVARTLKGDAIIRFNKKGEADIQGVWRRTYRVIHKNSRNVFHDYEKEERKTVGQAIAIEVKRPGGKQRPDQKLWQKAFEAMGGIYILTDSLDDCRRQIEMAVQADVFILG